jgi:hypothetical protein
MHVVLDDIETHNVAASAAAGVGHELAKRVLPHFVLVVAAASLDDANGQVAEYDWDVECLLAAGVLVAARPGTRDGRSCMPLAPTWCQTLHKVQCATLGGVVINLDDGSPVEHFYSAIRRVATLESLHFIRTMPPSLVMTLQFAPAVHCEMKRLEVVKVRRTIATHYSGCRARAMTA